MVKNKVTSQDLLQGVGAGLCLLDKDFRIQWVNKQQADWFGSPKDIQGKHCYNIFEHRPKVCPGCPTRRVFKTAKVEIGKRRIGYTQNGKQRYFQLTVSPIKDHTGNVLYALELVQDVTERIKKERQNNRFIRQIKIMYQRLSLVNKKLHYNLDRLKGIVNKIMNSNLKFRRRYKRQKSSFLKIKKELESIFKINRTLTSGIDSKKIASLITHFTCELMHTEGCVLRLLDKEKQTLTITASYGVSKGFLKKQFPLKVKESVVGLAVTKKKPVVIENVDKDLRLKPKSKELLKEEGIKSVLCMPVVFQNNILGVISTYSKKPRHFLSDEIEVLNIFASQVAIALQESRYYENIHMNYFNTIHSLALALEARDIYTRGHTERVTRYALEIAHAFSLSPHELEILRYASQVHDIGKISIPDSILGKPGKLTPDERAIVELHPVKGEEVLEPLDFLKPALPVVRHHHERYDGTGYPDGLSKERIPLLARIIACADAFDAMTSERPYRRRKLTVQEALKEIKNNAGSQFDPRVSQVFIKIIRTQLPA